MDCTTPPHHQPSPLLRLPLELRLMIYEYLVLPTASPYSSQSTSVTNLLPDHHTYFSADINPDPFTLTVRTMDPYLNASASRTWRRRSTYHVRSGPFLTTTTTPTTYRVLLSPYTAHLRTTVPALLRVSHQVHAEAAKVLYGSYTWAFHTHVEAVVPFLGDLTSVARSSVRSLSLTKKALPYAKEFDRAEWAHLCDYLASSVCLRTLGLGVVAGKPGPEGWDHVQPISSDDFRLMARMKREWGSEVAGVDLEWVEQLMRVRGLREVSVKALVEHCPVPRSEGVGFWVAFSRSVEGGLAEWVRGGMVGGS